MISLLSPNSWSVCLYGFFWFASLHLQGMFGIGCGRESAQSCMSGFLVALKQSKQTLISVDLNGNGGYLRFEKIKYSEKLKLNE